MKLFDAILKIKDGQSITEISKEINSCYSHTQIILSYLEDKKLITIKKIGRKMIIDMTKKGMTARKYITDLDMLVKLSMKKDDVE